MWALIIILTSISGTSAIGISHVDSFISKKLCEQAGVKVVTTMKNVKVEYGCVLEIN